jgi:hypothetical protein
MELLRSKLRKVAGRDPSPFKGNAPMDGSLASPQSRRDASIHVTAALISYATLPNGTRQTLDAANATTCGFPSVLEPWDLFDVGVALCCRGGQRALTDSRLVVRGHWQHFRLLHIVQTASEAHPAFFPWG